MRPTLLLRKSRPVQLGASAVMLAIPASAVALTAGQSDTPSAIQIKLAPRHAAYGRRVSVAGTVPAAAAGQTLSLQFAAKGARGWRVVRSTIVDGDGRFAFAMPARKSGLVRVVPAGVTAARPAAGGTGGSAVRVVTTGVGGVGGAAIAPSSPAPVSVRARLFVRGREHDVLAGEPVHVDGKLLPALAGRRVRLLARSGRSWTTVAGARTGARGGFDLRYRGTDGTGRRWLRVRFAGDRFNGATWAHAGRISVFRESVASWYTDGGGTACGFHAYYGVANRTLPCGTKVTFRAGGHTVTAVVDDRGPFVGGREWDLNQNLAGALGFGGVGTVWSSI